jgi:hypothetical protein
MTEPGGKATLAAEAARGHWTGERQERSGAVSEAGQGHDRR